MYKVLFLLITMVAAGSVYGQAGRVKATPTPTPFPTPEYYPPRRDRIAGADAFEPGEGDSLALPGRRTALLLRALELQDAGDTGLDAAGGGDHITLRHAPAQVFASAGLQP